MKFKVNSYHFKLLRDYENTDVSESALKLVRETIEFEERNLERAKTYI